MFTSIVRYIVVAVVAWAAAKGIIKPNSVTDAQIAALTNGVIFVGTVLGAIVWSWLEKQAKALNVRVDIKAPDTTTISLQPKVTTNPQSTGNPETK